MFLARNYISIPYGLSVLFRIGKAILENLSTNLA
jgi:hypothetical protein